MTTYHINFTYPAMAEEDPQYDHEIELTCPDYIQLTYQELRIGPVGDVMAWHSGPDALWHLADPSLVPSGKVNEFSDIVIWTEED